MFCVWIFEFSVLKKQSQTQPNHAVNFSKVLSKKENMQQGISQYMLTSPFHRHMALSLKNTELKVRHCEGPNKLTYLQTVTSKAG